MAVIEQLESRSDIGALAEARGRLGITAHGETERVADEWWRIASTNPFGRSVHLVVKEAGQIVAAASYVPKALCSKGQVLPVAEIGGTFTAPAAQGRGYFSQLVRELVERASESGLQALYGTPNEQSGRIYLERLHWRPVMPWIRWLRPTSIALRPAFDLFARVRQSRGPKHATFETVDPLLAHDSLDFARAQSDHFMRTPEQFAWRYPSSRYRMIVCKVDGETVAWCVVGPTVRLGRESVAIADMGIGENGEWAASGLFRVASQGFPAARLVFGASLRNGHYNVWRGVGAVPRASSMPIIAHAAADARGDHLFDSIAFDIGDSDTV